MPAPLRLLACLTIASALCGAAGAESFRFWPGKGASSAPGFKRMWEHPCGEVAEAEVSKLPLTTYRPLQPDLVVELNRRGKVVRRWPAPVDYVVHTIKGDELLVTAGDRGFWIRPDGRFRRASTIPPASETLTACDLTHVFGKSAYNQCSIFTDLAGGKKRKLGYQGICT
jgi:hypothetical protein